MTPRRGRRRHAAPSRVTRRGARPRRDHHGRQPPLGPRSAACPSSRATRPASRRSATLLRHAVRRGIQVLTLYAFSRENWARADDEVAGLFGLLEAAIRERDGRAPCSRASQVRLLGRLDELPEQTRALHRVGPRGHGRRRAAGPQRRLQLRRPHRDRGRGPAASSATASRPDDDRRGDDLRRASTPPACRTRTC